MKKITLIIVFLSAAIVGFSQKKTNVSYKPSNVATGIEKTIPEEIKGTWMYGNFSTTEYWSTAPRNYLGNALTFAIAFTFNADGTYEHYFTSSSVLAGSTIYHQSVTKGTFKVDESTKSITTTPLSSHYKRTKMGITEEDRDLTKKEVSGLTTYTYKKGKEPNGTEAIYLTLQGTSSPLTFLKKALR